MSRTGTWIVWLQLTVVVAIAAVSVGAVTMGTGASAAEPKMLLLVGQGPDNHPRGTHEYTAGVELLAKLLEPNKDLTVHVVNGDEPWTEGPELLAKADGAVIFLSEGARWLQAAPRRYEAFERLAARGGGLATQGAWCAWVDTTGSLNAPFALGAGVDLARLLVVTPPADKLAKVAVRMAESRAFSVLVIDAVGALGDPDRARADEVARWATTVRRLSLAIEGSDRAIVLLTDLWARRPTVLPVAMRIEIERPLADRLIVRVGKDRFGRVTSNTAIPIAESA